MTDQSLDYDAVTRVHDEIQRVVRQRGGRPALADSDGDDPAVTLRFPGGDDDVALVDWPEFFDRFEEADLAFAYDTGTDPERAGPACELVDAGRVDDVDGGPSDPEARRREEQSRAKKQADERAVSRAERRADEAADQENADNHRDEPPFNS